MFDSYLSGSFLGSSDIDIPQNNIGPQPVIYESQTPQEMVALPGGIVLPKKTLIVLAVAVAIAGYIWYRRNQKG